MKEEIFLFYKEHIGPAVKFLSSYLRHHFRSIPLVQVIYSNKSKRVKYKYLATSEEDLSNYIEMEISASVFKMKEVNELDMNCYYIFLGSYDKVIFFLNYLREKGFKTL